MKLKLYIRLTCSVGTCKNKRGRHDNDRTKLRLRDLGRQIIELILRSVNYSPGYGYGPQKHAATSAITIATSRAAKAALSCGKHRDTRPPHCCAIACSPASLLPTATRADTAPLRVPLTPAAPLGGCTASGLSGGPPLQLPPPSPPPLPPPPPPPPPPPSIGSLPLASRLLRVISTAEVAEISTAPSSTAAPAAVPLPPSPPAAPPPTSPPAPPAAPPAAPPPTCTRRPRAKQLQPRCSARRGQPGSSERPCSCICAGGGVARETSTCVRTHT